MKTLLQSTLLSLGLLAFTGQGSPVFASAGVLDCTIEATTCSLPQKYSSAAAPLRIAQAPTRSERMELFRERMQQIQAKQQARMEEFREKAAERRVINDLRRMEIRAANAERRAKRAKLRREKLYGKGHSTGAGEIATRRAKKAAALRYKQAQKARMQKSARSKTGTSSLFLENKPARKGGFAEIKHSR